MSTNIPKINEEKTAESLKVSAVLNGLEYL